MRLRALAPAKVNLSLFLGPTREDGRHRLVTVFESLSLADTLELEVPERGRAMRSSAPASRARTWRRWRSRRCARAAGTGRRVRIDDREADPGCGRNGRRLGGRRRRAAAGDGGRARPGRGGRSGGGRARRRRAGPAAAGRVRRHRRGRDRRALRAARGARVRGAAVRSSRCRRRTSSARPTGSGSRAATRSSPAPTCAGERVRTPGGRLPDELMVNELEPAAVSLCPACADALEAVRNGRRRPRDRVRFRSDGGRHLVGWWRSRASRLKRRTTLRGTLPGAVVAVTRGCRVRAAGVNLSDLTR